MIRSQVDYSQAISMQKNDHHCDLLVRKHEPDSMSHVLIVASPEQLASLFLFIDFNVYHTRLKCNLMYN